MLLMPLDENEEPNFMITYLSAGVVLGLSAGFSPGPLLALVISQSLRHGVKEGTKVALAPLVTDFPIILISTFLLTRLANFRPVLGVISLVGGLFVLSMAYETLRPGRIDTPRCPWKSSSVRRSLSYARPAA